jgi:hypothetical protein
MLTPCSACRRRQRCGGAFRPARSRPGPCYASSLPARGAGASAVGIPSVRKWRQVPGRAVIVRGFWRPIQIKCVGQEVRLRRGGEGRAHRAPRFPGFNFAHRTLCAIKRQPEKCAFPGGHSNHARMSERWRYLSSRRRLQNWPGCDPDIGTAWSGFVAAHRTFHRLIGDKSVFPAARSLGRER